METKAAEIAALVRFIVELGDESYLGPWLKEHYTTLVSQIGSDLPPSAPMPSEARRQAAQILQDARVEAARIKSDASTKAHEMREHALVQIENIKRSTRTKLHDALHQLEALR